jgi:hypothetical protein
MITPLILASALMSTQQSDMKQYKTFGNMGKQTNILKKDVETELFSYEGKGLITHMWFGGSFKGIRNTRIRFYIDGEEQPSIDMDLWMGHSMGFGDTTAPWGTAKLGKTGDPSGVYNSYKVPFGSSIRITGELAPDAEPGEIWWIFRGTENLPLMYGGVELPDNARLKLHKVIDYKAKPLEEFDIANVEGDGAIYQVAMEADGEEIQGNWRDLSYMEAVVRAYIGGAKEPMNISSGLEDYFLGTYYFSHGRYANELAGLTHIDKEKNRFSGYRFHDDDPIFFQDGLRLTNRCGETLGDEVLHGPPPTVYTTYVWLYQW